MPQLTLACAWYKPEEEQRATENPTETRALNFQVALVKLLSVAETVYLAKVRLMVCRRQQDQIGVREVTSVGLEIIISTSLGWYISVISALGRQRQEDHVNLRLV